MDRGKQARSCATRAPPRSLRGRSRIEAVSRGRVLNEGSIAPSSQAALLHGRYGVTVRNIGVIGAVCVVLSGALSVGGSVSADALARTGGAVRTPCDSALRGIRTGRIDELIGATDGTAAVSLGDACTVADGATSGASGAEVGLPYCDRHAMNATMRAAPMTATIETQLTPPASSRVVERTTCCAEKSREALWLDAVVAAKAPLALVAAKGAANGIPSTGVAENRG